MTDDLSNKMRAYLAEIYRLADRAHESQVYVSTSALADLLDVSAPAVNRMINRLKEMDLLEHEPYQGIRLTAAGEHEALKFMRSQRIAEAFLVNVMKLGWDQVHHEAQNISGSLNDRLLMRMAEMAGHPTFCPHGEPIPNADGHIAEMNDQLLSESRDGQHLEVTRVITRESDRLQYIAALGLMPGTHLDVLHVAPFNGPMQLRIGDEYRIVGSTLAELIRVRAADPPG
jgi:DtxR family Mn-dependent transcriptional regulator